MNLHFRRHRGHNGEDTETRDRLASEFRSTIADTESFLRSLATSTGENVEQARQRMRDRLHQARMALGDGQAVVRDRVSRATHATEDYVSDNPWRSLSAALAVGAVIGFLIHIASTTRR